MSDLKTYFAAPGRAETPSAAEAGDLAVRFPWFLPGRILRETLTGESDPRVALTAPWRAESSLRRAAVDASALDDGRTIVSNSRHYEALHHAHTALDAALGGLETLPSDLLGEEIRQAIFHLGTITGEITTDEVLGQIFSKFCIGK